MKVLIKNCSNTDNDKLIKFTKEFKQLHLNLLVQEDVETLEQMEKTE